MFGKTVTSELTSCLLQVHSNMNVANDFAVKKVNDLVVNKKTVVLLIPPILFDLSNNVQAGSCTWYLVYLLLHLRSFVNAKIGYGFLERDV